MTMGLSLFALMCLFSIPLFLLLYLVLPRRWHKSASRRLVSFGFRNYLRALHWICDIHADFSALTPLRDEPRLILIANHPSLLDAVILLGAFPNACCVLKASLLDNPLYGVGARMASYVSNREAKKMIEDASGELAQGTHFVLFPEGGRSREFPVSTFSSACVLLARHSGVPIQAVILESSTPYLGKYWGLLNPPVLPLTIRARLGQRFDPPTQTAGMPAELEAYFRHELSSHG